MKKFKIRVLKCMTLELISEHIIEAESVEEARALGIKRYQTDNGIFIGAQSM